MISAGAQKLRLGSAPYPGPDSRVLLCRRRGERGSTLLPPLCPAMSELTGPPSAHSAPSPESHDGAPQGANGAKAKRKRLSKVCLMPLLRALGTSRSRRPSPSSCSLFTLGLRRVPQKQAAV
jgi:hypothetical protein